MREYKPRAINLVNDTDCNSTMYVRLEFCLQDVDQQNLQMKQMLLEALLRCALERYNKYYGGRAVDIKVATNKNQTAVITVRWSDVFMPCPSMLAGIMTPFVSTLSEIVNHTWMDMEESDFRQMQMELMLKYTNTENGIHSNMKRRLLKPSTVVVEHEYWAGCVSNESFRRYALESLSYENCAVTISYGKTSRLGDIVDFTNQAIGKVLCQLCNNRITTLRTETDIRRGVKAPVYYGAGYRDAIAYADNYCPAQVICLRSMPTPEYSVALHAIALVTCEVLNYLYGKTSDDDDIVKRELAYTDLQRPNIQCNKNTGNLFEIAFDNNRLHLWVHRFISKTDSQLYWASQLKEIDVLLQLNVSNRELDNICASVIEQMFNDYSFGTSESASKYLLMDSMDSNWSLDQIQINGYNPSVISSFFDGLWGVDGSDIRHLLKCLSSEYCPTVLGYIGPMQQDRTMIEQVLLGL